MKNNISSNEDFINVYNETKDNIDLMMGYIERCKQRNSCLASDTIFIKASMELDDIENLFKSLYTLIGNYYNAGCSISGPIFSGSEIKVDCYNGDILGVEKDVRHNDLIVNDNGTTKVYREV